MIHKRIDLDRKALDIGTTLLFQYSHEIRKHGILIRKFAAGKIVLEKFDRIARLGSRQKFAVAVIDIPSGCRDLDFLDTFIVRHIAILVAIDNREFEKSPYEYEHEEYEDRLHDIKSIDFG